MTKLQKKNLNPVLVIGKSPQRSVSFSTTSQRHEKERPVSADGRSKRSATVSTMKYADRVPHVETFLLPNSMGHTPIPCTAHHGHAAKKLKRKPSTLDLHKPRKKALLIGIAYEGTDGGLTGPHKDVLNMKALLIEKYAYLERNITVLLDNGKTPLPTRENILNALAELVRDAKAGDAFLVHYSGHGGQKVREVQDGTEDDGKDETIIPCDAINDDSMMIIDDELYDYLVRPLPVGCRMMTLFDSCHSGTVLDLPHYRCHDIYVPWLNRGRRRSDEKRYAVYRRNALDPNAPKTAVQFLPKEEHKATTTIRTFSRLTKRKVTEVTFPFEAPSSAAIQAAVTASSSASKPPTGKRKEGYARVLKPRYRTMSIKVAREPPSPRWLTRTPTSSSFSTAAAMERQCALCQCQILARQAAMGVKTIRQAMAFFTPAFHQRKKRHVTAPPPSSRTSITTDASYTTTTTTAADGDVAGVSTNGVSMKGDGGGEGCWCQCHLRQSSTRNSTSRKSSLWFSGDKSKKATAARTDSERTVRASRAQSQVLDDDAARGRGDEKVWADEFGYGFTRSMSPVSSPEGCLSPHGGSPVEERPFVVQVSACNDHQQAFEDKNGVSMTAMLIDILNENPRPTYKNLMTQLSHRMWVNSQEMAKFYRGKKKRMELEEKQRHEKALSTASASTASESQTTPSDDSTSIMSKEELDELVALEPIQAPQLGSQKMINMEVDCFEL